MIYYDPMDKGGLMPRKIVLLAIVAVICVTFSGLALAAQENKAASGKPNVTAIPRPPRAAFSMVAGKIEKIDTSDPANLKLEVKNESDGKMHSISVSANTSITKVTDPSELKTGDNVRIMSRNSDGKETATMVMFGKLRPMVSPRPMPQQMAAIPQTAAVSDTQKNQKR